MDPGNVPSPELGFDGMGGINPVIMCGGAGTRLWPASRESMPKQFIPLLGEHSTFQTAVKRVSNSKVFSKPTVVTHCDARFVVAEQLAQIGMVADILLEPQRRDSAAAVAVAAHHAAQRQPDGVVLVIAADHLMPDDAAFVAACGAAAEAARQGVIMTLGVAPDHPATGYGYIAPGEPIRGTQARHVARFIEKPDARTAQGYIAEGCLWNSGNFLFRADVLLDELERFEPTVVGAARDAVGRAQVDLDFIRLDEGAFRLAPKLSID